MQLVVAGTHLDLGHAFQNTGAWKFGAYKRHRQKRDDDRGAPNQDLGRRKTQAGKAALCPSWSSM